MRMDRKRRWLVGTLTIVGAVGAVAGCGEEDFGSEPRPAVAKELTGVIQDRGVTVSPSLEGDTVTPRSWITPASSLATAGRGSLAKSSSPHPATAPTAPTIVRVPTSQRLLRSILIPRGGTLTEPHGRSRPYE